MLGDLYGGDDIGKPRDADVIEGSHHIRVDLSPPRQIAAPDIASKQEIERIRGQIGHADDQVGVHDVVDEGNVLVADALDIVLAISVPKHGPPLYSLHPA